MTPIIKLYVKTFLLTGIPYGIITLGFDLADGSGLRIWKLLISAFFFGILMSLILVSIHWYWLNKIGVREMSDENISVHQKRILKTKLNKFELIEKLKADPGIRKMKMTEVEDGIILRTDMTWKSWGEEMKINIQAIGENDFEYQITSSPKIKTTLVDFGINLENVNRIENTIKNND